MPLFLIHLLLMSHLYKLPFCFLAQVCLRGWKGQTPAKLLSPLVHFEQRFLEVNCRNRSPNRAFETATVGLLTCGDLQLRWGKAVVCGFCPSNRAWSLKIIEMRHQTRWRWWPVIAAPGSRCGVDCYLTQLFKHLMKSTNISSNRITVHLLTFLVAWTQPDMVWA